jgi:hypothetical protein
MLPENPLTTVSVSIPGFEHVVPGNVVSFDLETTRPRAVHLVEWGEDHAYRASVSGCKIDPLTGGAFTVTTPGHPDLHLQVPPGHGHAVHVAAQPRRGAGGPGPGRRGGGGVLAPGQGQWGRAAQRVRLPRGVSLPGLDGSDRPPAP